VAAMKSYPIEDNEVTNDLANRGRKNKKDVKNEG
jgi:hypothetical protein